MQRNLVQVARIRLVEVVPGDVVNRDSDASRGWFVAGIIEPLFDGTLNISDAVRKESFAAFPMDICGVQTLRPMEIPPSEEAPYIAPEYAPDADVGAPDDGAHAPTADDLTAEPVAV